MDIERVRAPEQIPLPAIDSASARLDERVSNEMQCLRSSESNAANNLGWTSTTFEGFVSLTEQYFISWGPWLSSSRLAARSLPFGGLVAIPLPRSTDHHTSDFYEMDEETSDLKHSGASSIVFSRNLDQGTCSDHAELPWRYWQEHGTRWKPRLVVFEGTGFQNWNKDWVKDDLIRLRGEDTVKLWTSRHLNGRYISPALLSAEFHVILNSGLDELQLQTLPSPVESFRLAAVMITQHMGSLWQRFQLPPLMTAGFCPFYHRIQMFEVGDQFQLSKYIKSSHKRDSGRFPASGPAAKTDLSVDYGFYESRTSIIAAFEHAKDVRTLRTVLVIQDTEVDNDQTTMEMIEKLNSTERANFLPTLLRQHYSLWERSWNRCLDGIDSSVKITLEDLSDDARLDTFMFDGPTFERSRAYFAALQILRIFSDRIKETRQDLIAAINQVGQRSAKYKSAGLEESESRLLQRIDRKTGEIKTLRDGLFNSTSVREATRATEMNRYIIVFTFVTVLYIPPSFISALFATPLPYFTKGDPDDFKRAVGIASGTTVLIAVILLLIANTLDDFFRNPKERLIFVVRRVDDGVWALFFMLRFLARVPLRPVRETGRSLQGMTGRVLQRRQRPQVRNTPSQESEIETGQRHSEQTIDLHVLATNAANPPQDDHSDNMV